MKFTTDKKYLKWTVWGHNGKAITQEELETELKKEKEGEM